MKLALIVVGYLVMAAMLALFAAWFTSRKHCKLRWSLGLYYTSEGGRTQKGLFKWTTHGPQSWPWWRLVVFSLSPLNVYPPSTAQRMWIYTRWGSFHIDMCFDRRSLRYNDGTGGA